MARRVRRERTPPALDLEAGFWASGFRRVAGLDEAGRGAWAGPVVAAAVLLPPGDPQTLVLLSGVRDSKQLSPRQREHLREAIVDHALGWGVGVVPADQVDAQGIVASTRQAMLWALEALTLPADSLLIDHLSLPGVVIPQCSLPKGDARVLSIAAASIIAKVHRDRIMGDLDARFPGYAFARNKGYGTEQHRQALESLGPCPIHRLSFAPVRSMLPDARHQPLPAAWVGRSAPGRRSST